MGEMRTVAHNKRRSEGKEKSGKTKNPRCDDRKPDPANTTCYLQILGNGMDTQDTSPSVLLFFDRLRFIFNAGEGFQRFCSEHNIQLSKIDHMFLTRVCSETAGGLPGLLLTLADMTEEGISVNIWGPSDLNYLVDAMRSFIPEASMVHMHSFEEKQTSYETTVSSSELGRFADHIVLIDGEVVRISAIPLRPRHPGGTTVKPGDIAVIYVCELPEIKGKFDRNKAANLGLKEGPKYGELKHGKSVMSDCGSKMIHPSQVLGPSVPGPIVLLVDCPTLSHMEELLSAQSLNSYYVDTSNQAREGTKSVNCIVHLGPASVTKDADYQNWMKRFGSARHIIAGHEMTKMGIPILRYSATISARLNYLCPQFFPASGFSSLQHISKFSVEPNRSCEDPYPTHDFSVSAENLLKFHLRPYAQLGLDRSVVPSTLNHTEIVNELLSEFPQIVDASKHVSQFWQGPLEDKSLIPPMPSNLFPAEPLMDETPSIRNGYLGKQEAVASQGVISHLNGSCKGGDNHNNNFSPCLENISREDMEFILLGTGSKQPSKFRNVSSIFVNLFSKGSLLLDCGEGTLAQLKRRFGMEGADNAVKGLRYIWISHIHADHQVGLVRILSKRCQLLKDIPHEPLLVIGPRPLKKYLDLYSRLEDLDMQFLDCRHTTKASLSTFLSSHDSGEDCSFKLADREGDQDGGAETGSSHSLEATLLDRCSTMQSCWNNTWSTVDTAKVLPVLMRFRQLLCEAGLEALYSVPVDHCSEAFGIVLKAARRINSVGKEIAGWKLVYSGDTKFCQSLVDASRNATVLIHEATYEDNKAKEAAERKHSTIKDAIKVGESAGAYRIILTHFSQMYPKIPRYDEIDMHRTCIGFDLMSVNVADLPILPKILPYLKVLAEMEIVLK